MAPAMHIHVVIIDKLTGANWEIVRKFTNLHMLVTVQNMNPRTTL